MENSLENKHWKCMEIISIGNVYKHWKCMENSLENKHYRS